MQNITDKWDLTVKRNEEKLGNIELFTAKCFHKLTYQNKRIFKGVLIVNNKQYHLNVLLPPEMKEAIIELAQEMGFVNLSECVRHIVRDYLKTKAGGWRDAQQ